ncbi:inner membrane transport protein YeaN [Salmonella enterica subsp. enterica serovar Newport str. CVM 19536]|nr:inner membrane transport protein YeaN [Salmonella enterica subsp. enterica serovar Newport str. CVM 19536]
MTTALSPRGKQGALLIAGILMIATTLRVTFTGAAPLLETIRSDYGLSTAQTGLLTTLPLLAFALVSPLAAGIARRFGMERSLFAAMLLICAGIALRSLPSAALLFAGTAIIGCGIALGNVLLPGLIKRDFFTTCRQADGRVLIDDGRRRRVGVCAGGSAGVARFWLARRAVNANAVSAVGVSYLVAAVAPYPLS